MNKFTLPQLQRIYRTIYFDGDEMCVNTDLKKCHGNIETVLANVGEVFGSVGKINKPSKVPSLDENGKFIYLRNNHE